MKNAILNAPKVSAKNGIKLVKGEKGLMLETTKTAANVPDNATGEKIKKAKLLGAVMLEKMAINSAEKDRRASLTFNLNTLKGSAEKYVQLLATEHGCSISVEALIDTLKTPKVFLAYLSDKQRAKFDAKALKFNYWLILTLVSKYIKAQK